MQPLFENPKCKGKHCWHLGLPIPGWHEHWPLIGSHKLEVEPTESQLQEIHPAVILPKPAYYRKQKYASLKNT